MKEYIWPCIAYVKFSTDNFTQKHFLGVFDIEEMVNREQSASYFVCDALEKDHGWKKLTHNHDLEKDGVTMQIRHCAITLEDGRTVDDSYRDLQQPQALLDKMLLLLEQRVWERK